MGFFRCRLTRWAGPTQVDECNSLFKTKVDWTLHTVVFCTFFPRAKQEPLLSCAEIPVARPKSGGGRDCRSLVLVKRSNWIMTDEELILIFQEKKVGSGIYIFIMPFSYVVWCCGCYWCVKMHNCSVFVSIIITSSVSCIMTYCNLHPEVHDPKRQGTMCLLYAFHNRQASGEDFVEDVTERLTAPSSCVSRLVSKQLC